MLSWSRNLGWNSKHAGRQSRFARYSGARRDHPGSVPCQQMRNASWKETLIFGCWRKAMSPVYSPGSAHLISAGALHNNLAHRMAGPSVDRLSLRTSEDLSGHLLSTYISRLPAAVRDRHCMPSKAVTTSVPSNKTRTARTAVWTMVVPRIQTRSTVQGRPLRNPSITKPLAYDELSKQLPCWPCARLLTQLPVVATVLQGGVKSHLTFADARGLTGWC
ncbi:hypothetical protein GGR56DRAFT_340834 [Xylariaceae sp. FL0804]|nr:hypothetical protein GGR56DRAFT_340834 [Xylariaceae sp. FL0804]